MKFCLRLHHTGVNSYIFLKDVKIYKFKAKDSEINAAPICLGNVLKDFSVDTIKKIYYMDMCIIFQLVMIVMIFMLF